MVLVILAHSISSVIDVPTARLVDTVPAYGVCTCNSCICARRALNTIWCSYSNYWRVSMVMSLIVLPMLCRSPLVMVIRLKEVFEAFDFFHNRNCSLGCEHFSWVDTVCGFAPPCFIFVSSLSEGDFYPLCSSFVAFFCSFANFASSCVAWALAIAASFLRFSTNCAICIFTSSFFCYTADFSSSTMEPAGAHHSSGHDPWTAKMTSFFTR